MQGPFIRRAKDVTGYKRELVTGHWSLVTGHWSLVTGHWSLVIGLDSLVRHGMLRILRQLDETKEQLKHEPDGHRSTTDPDS